MTVHELNRDQIIELKQDFLKELSEEGESTLNNFLYGDPEIKGGLTFGELASADAFVSDDMVFEKYAGTEFVEEDFSL